MAYRSMAICGALLGVFVGCQSTTSRPTQGAPQGSLVSPPAASASVPASGTLSLPTGCDEPNWASSSTHDPSGHPTAVLRHPSAWQVVTSEPGRIQLMPPTQDFQVLASTVKGSTQTDGQVQQLDQASVGQLPILSPWRKVETAPTFRVFTVTRKTPQTNIELRYYAGVGGLVVLSIESPGPLKPDAARQWQSLVRCLNLSFQ